MIVWFDVSSDTPLVIDLADDYDSYHRRLSTQLHRHTTPYISAASQECSHYLRYAPRPSRARHESMACALAVTLADTSPLADLTT